jgi:hypothetical protein
MTSINHVHEPEGDRPGTFDRQRTGLGDVPAPPEAVGWTVRDGFVFDVANLHTARDVGVTTLSVEDGMVRDVTGYAPLAAVVRIDRVVAALAGEVESLHTRLLDVFESALDLLADRRP